MIQINLLNPWVKPSGVEINQKQVLKIKTSSSSPSPFGGGSSCLGLRVSTLLFTFTLWRWQLLSRLAGLHPPLHLHPLEVAAPASACGSPPSSSPSPSGGGSSCLGLRVSTLLFIFTLWRWQLLPRLAGLHPPFHLHPLGVAAPASACGSHPSSSSSPPFVDYFHILVKCDTR